MRRRQYPESGLAVRRPTTAGITLRTCCWLRACSASTDDACAVALETVACKYRFVRRYLEHNPQLPLSLRQVDPLIRQLTLYRDLIEKRTRQENDLCTL